MIHSFRVSFILANSALILWLVKHFADAHFGVCAEAAGSQSLAFLLPFGLGMQHVLQATVAGADGSVCRRRVALLLIDCVQLVNFLYCLLSKTNLLHDVLDVGVGHLFLRYISSMVVLLRFLWFWNLFVIVLVVIIWKDILAMIRNKVCLVLCNGRPGIELVDTRTELEHAHGVLVLGEVLVLVLLVFALWR